MSSGRFLDKSLKFDWVFMLTTFALMACGIVLVYSATLVGLLMRQAPNLVKENIVSSVLGTVLYPAQMALSSLNAYRSIVAENEQLKQENARLRQETYYASEGLQELTRLHALVRFDDKWGYPIVTARVVGHNPGRFLTTLIINRGTHHGVKENKSGNTTVTIPFTFSE